MKFGDGWRVGGKQGVDERITVLVVEDDHLIQAMLEEALSDGGFATATVASGEEAIAILKPDSSKSKVCATSSIVARLITEAPAAKPFSNALSHKLLMLRGMPSEQRKM